ncbi:MAG: Gfo/Idh/MocA family oxidoreductase [Fimbriimonadaceae bacterium]|nr:Gfo/Idh/MocA family oxidoreductase [Fimbriimonadaceae bacterium]
MGSVKVGLLGAGGIGNVHARHYSAMPDVELHVFDIHPEKVDTIAKAHRAIPCSSFDDLIAKVDAVDICLPSNLHYEFGMKSIAAGKPTMVEKPIATTLEHASEMMEASEKAEVPLFVGQVVRFFPEFRTAHNLVENGTVGIPAAARMRRGGGPPRSHAEWFFDHEKSGGVLLDLAIHDFDWLRWTLGEVKHLYSRSVGAKTGKGLDYALTTLTFDSGAVAHTETTWMDPGGFRVALEVCGSEGMIEFDSRHLPTLRVNTGDIKVTEGPLAPKDDPYYRELSAFLAAVTKGEPLPITAYDGFMALSISLAALDSARTGRVVAPARQI